MQLHLIREPRALVLSSSSWCLVFRTPPSQSSSAAPAVVVELLPKADIDLRYALTISKSVYGCLGVIRMGGDTFLPMITSSTTLSPRSQALQGVGTDSVSRILSVDFFCVTSSTFDPFVSVSPESDSRAEPLEHPCAGIRKILSNGSFYFSSGEDSFDLSTRLEGRLNRAEEQSKLETESHELPGTKEFLWNSFLVTPLLAFRTSLTPEARRTFDREGFIVMAIQGYAGIQDVVVNGKPGVLSLISRLGWKRAGTRFNVRGVDDEGAVANFVETETLLRTDKMCLSFTQIRGSIPLFWEETGVQPFGLSISITRPIESSLPAFVRHFQDLTEKYQRVHIVNLLGSKDQEATLTRSYQAHLVAASEVDEVINSSVRFTEFDFHAVTKEYGIESVKSMLSTSLGDSTEELGSCLVSVDEKGASVVVGQRGVFRTNCKDCLDRTNVVEDVLSRCAIEEFMRVTGTGGAGSESLWSTHRTLFADNGDVLSKIYVGTGALNTSATRSGKKSFAGLLSDATKSVGRMYQSNFIDSGKQESIDALLGHLSTSEKIRVFDPISDELHLRMTRHRDVYTAYQNHTIWVGSYNLNGIGPEEESLLPWLFPTSNEDPTFLVIGFQEIVSLDARTVLITDPQQLRRWEASIMQALQQAPKQSSYVLLRSFQLVGTALLVLCKTEIAPSVRSIEATSKKTGLKGMAGNKGAVAIRLELQDTSFCFVTAHLAAGHSNPVERDADYLTISDGLHFQRGKTIASHDNVIWASDTNYRISLPGDEVRRLVEEDDYAALQAYDQLGRSMRQNPRIFTNFSEGPLLFRPTYKYDNGTQTYDTSEKLRIPAWTDRILFSGSGLTLKTYQRAELLASDHRPVYAIFTAQVRAIDRVKKASLREKLLREVEAELKGVKLDSGARRNGSQLPVSNLPPPSDEKQAWWHGSGPELISSDALARLSLSTSSNPENPFVGDFKSPSPTIRKTPAAPPIPSKPLIIASSRPSPQSSFPSVPPPSLSKASIPPPVPSRPKNPPTNLLDDDDVTSAPASGVWQVIEADRA